MKLEMKGNVKRIIFFSAFSAALRENSFQIIFKLYQNQAKAKCHYPQ